MNLNELRIGNYIQWNNFKEARIMNYKDFSIIYELLLNNNYEDIKPIPLTEEWLERFNFYKIGNEYSLADGFFYICFKFYKNGNKKIWINGEGEKYIKGEEMFINYVHQLQNLYLDLTKKEL
jgi:hypothetical protein